MNEMTSLTSTEMMEIDGGGPILLAIGVAAVIGGAYVVGYAASYIYHSL